MDLKIAPVAEVVQEMRAAAQRLRDESARYAELPDKLQKTLLPYQREGVRAALQRSGRCLIGDEMGLGKTLQAWLFLPACDDVGWCGNKQPVEAACSVATVMLMPAAHLLHRPASVDADVHNAFQRGVWYAVFTSQGSKETRGKCKRNMHAGPSSDASFPIRVARTGDLPRHAAQQLG